MAKHEKRSLTEWVKDNEWFGNPSMNLESYSKGFLKFNNTPVFIFGSDENGWSFCVVGHYTGGFPNGLQTIEQRMEYVDNLYKANKLFK